MADELADEDKQESRPAPARTMRLPGFVPETDVGLGDVISRAASYMNIRPCDGCAQRAERLNQMMTFTGKRRG